MILKRNQIKAILDRIAANGSYTADDLTQLSDQYYWGGEEALEKIRQALDVPSNYEVHNQ